MFLKQNGKAVEETPAGFHSNAVKEALGHLHYSKMTLPLLQVL